MFKRLADPLRDRPGDAREVRRLGRALADGVSGRPADVAQTGIEAPRDDVLSSRGT